MKLIRTGAGIGLAAAGVLWFSTTLSAREALVTLVPECEVTIGVEHVPVQADPVSVPLSLSEDLGEGLTASVPEESGLTIQGLQNGREDEAPTALHLVLGTRTAAAGEWPLVIESEDKQCHGVIHVVAPETYGRR